MSTPTAASAPAAATTPTTGTWTDLPFDELEVGMTLTSARMPVTETDLLTFAALTGDRYSRGCAHRPPADPAGRPHSLLVLAYAMGLMPLDPKRVIAMREVRDLDFLRPPAAGETIFVQGVVAAVEPMGEDVGRVRVRFRVVADPRTTLATGTVAALWRRSGEGGEA